MTPKEHFLSRAECQELLEQIVEMLGAETVVDEINTQFSSDDVSWFIEELDKDYELGLFDNESTEYE